MNKILIKYWKPIFYSVIVLVIVISSLSVLWLPPETENAPVLLVFMPFIAYVLMVLMAIMYKKMEGESFVWGKKFYQGASLGLALMAMIFLIELASGLIRIKDISPGFWDILIGGIILQGIVVVGEELPFRGYIVPDLAKKYGIWTSVLMSSLFFSILHVPSILTIQNISTANILIMLMTITLAEIILALCYIHDGLLMSMGFHFAWNFSQYHLFSLREGFGGILTLESQQPLLTGGTLGPEAGLLGTIVVVLALAIVFSRLPSKSA